jgi:hypothetical protein
VITEKKNNTLTAQIQHLGAELISLKIESRERIHLGGNPEFWENILQFYFNCWHSKKQYFSS